MKNRFRFISIPNYLDAFSIGDISSTARYGTSKYVTVVTSREI